MLLPTWTRVICPILVGKDIKQDAVGGQFEPYHYCRMRMHSGGALVVWPGMLFPNSRGYQSCGENQPLTKKVCYIAHPNLPAEMRQLHFQSVDQWSVSCEKDATEEVNRGPAKDLNNLKQFATAIACRQFEGRSPYLWRWNAQAWASASELLLLDACGLQTIGPGPHALQLPAAAAQTSHVSITGRWDIPTSWRRLRVVQLEAEARR